MGTIKSATCHLSIAAGVNIGLVGLQAWGQIYSRFENNKYLVSASLLLSLGFLGDYYLHGEVSNNGVYLEASSTTGVDAGGLIKQAIKKGVKDIFGVSSGPLSNSIDDIFGNAFKLNSMKFTLDTRTTSDKKMVKLRINMTIGGQTVDFSIQIGSNVSITEGQIIHHVLCYLTSTNIFPPCVKLVNQV